jgi:hypothetical protein
MTPEVSRIMSPDLYVDNESLVFDRDRAEELSRPAPPLAAVSFVAKAEGLPDGLQELERLGFRFLEAPKTVFVYGQREMGVFLMEKMD